MILLAGDYIQVPWRQREGSRRELRHFLREMHFTRRRRVRRPGNVDPDGWEEIFARPRRFHRRRFELATWN